MGLLDELDKRRGQVEITQENRARLAQAYGTLVSTGLGVIQFEDPISFGMTFVERPRVTGDSIVDPEALADVLGLSDPDTVPMPHVSRYVVHWDQDDNDFYVGAWVAVKVSFDLTDLIDGAAQPTIEHDFVFHGIAMKTIPVDVSDYSLD